MVVHLPDQSLFRRTLRRMSWGLAVGLGLPFLVLIWLVLYLFSAAKWTEHSIDVLGQVYEVERHVLNMDTALRGFLLSQEDQLFQPYKTSETRVNETLTSIFAAVADNPEQARTARDLHAAYLRWRGFGDSLLNQAQAAGNNPVTAEQHLQDKKFIEEMFVLTRRFIDKENDLLAVRSAQLGLFRSLVIGALLLIGLVVLPFGIWWLRKRLYFLNNAYSESHSRLHQQAEQIRVTLRSIGDAVVSTDADGKVVFLNPVAEQLMGWKSAEAQGRELHEVFPIFNETTGKVVENPVQRVLREKAIVGLANHTVLKAKDGTDRPIDDSAAPITDDEGNILGVILVFHDVSEKRGIERRLSESERKYRILVEISPQSVWMAKPDGELLYINEHWLQFSGLSLRESLGNGWLQAVHREHRSVLAQAWQKALTREDKWQAEILIRRHDGAYRWHFIQGVPVANEEKEVVHWMGIALDIHDRKEVEEALRHSDESRRLAVDASSLGTWDFFPKTGELRWDERCKEFFYLPVDAKIDYSVFLAGLHPEDREESDKKVQEALSPDGPGFFDVEYRTVSSKDPGIMRWIRSVGRTFFNDNREAVRFVGTVQDITTLKEHDTALHLARDQAEAASRAKDSFLAALSHELRTPLTPVLMTTASLAEDSRLPEDVREQLVSAQRNIELEARLIDDLLDITRISQGRLSLRPQSCDVHSLILLALEIVRDEAQNKKLHLHLDLAATRPLIVGDPARIQQLFWNILRNAVKFTSDGDRISLRTEDTQSGGLLIVVEDTGIGIATDAIDRIFKPFEQAASGHEHRFGGLGLGLSIAKAVVDLHGGTIRAESAGVGQGTAFYMEFPDAKELPAEMPADHSVHAAGDTAADMATQKSSSLHLLLVEDHEPSLIVLSRLLKRAGHDVVTASTVASALEIARSQAFDGVVSDLGLPDGSGLTLMKQLRAEYGLLGIALSGYGMEEDLKHSQEAGFIIHLVKPVVFGQLRQALTELLKAKSQEPVRPVTE